MADGAIAAGKKAGFEIDIVNVAQSSSDASAAAIDAASADPQVVGVVAAFLHPKENELNFAALVKPFVTIDGALGGDVGQITHIGSNDTASGSQTAAYFDSINKKHALCLLVVADSLAASANLPSSLSGRCAAAEAAFKGKFSVARVSTTADIAAVLAADTTIDAVYGSGIMNAGRDPVAALASLGTPDRAVSFVYHDLSGVVVEQLKAGKIDWLIDQQPFLQGYLSVVVLALKINFGVAPLNKDILTGPIFYDKTSIELHDNTSIER